MTSPYQNYPPTNTYTTDQQDPNGYTNNIDPQQQQQWSTSYTNDQQQQQQYYNDQSYQQQQPNMVYDQVQQQQQQPNMAYNQVQQDFNQMSLGYNANQATLPPPQQQQQQQQYAPQPSMMSQRPIIPDGVKVCDPRHLSLTTHALPASKQLCESSKIPLGIISQPLAVTGEDVPMVNFGATGVVRCRECRGYINPYVYWLDGGQRWRCNFCTKHNDVPSTYYCALDQVGYRQDRFDRVELCHSTVDIIAPSEYMMRAPMPPVYVFLIDVSANSIQSGLLYMFAQAVKSCLDMLPGGGRQRVAFITFDSKVHFYSLSVDSNGPQMFVLSDLDDIMLPQPLDLLVNVEESRIQIDAFLDGLPEMFNTSQDVECAFGPALDGAMKLMRELGGRLLCFTSGLPSLGTGRLLNREDPRLLGSANEHTLLKPATDFYQKKAILFTRFQISIDIFIFAHDYVDIATISTLAQNTGGQCEYYPNFNHIVDGERFMANLQRSLTQDCGWEAVVRIRCASAMKLEKFRGNFFLRGTDLLALPSLSTSASITADLSYKDTQLTSNSFSVQSALLYTSSSGERRIRVSTLCVPVTNIISEIFMSASNHAIVSVLSKVAVDDVVFHGFKHARQRLQNTCSNILRAQYHHTTSRGAPLEHDQLSALPLTILGVLKSRAFCDGNDIRSDERSYLLTMIRSNNMNTLDLLFRPRMFLLDNLNGDTGLWDESGSYVHLPTEVSLSAANLTPKSIFLIDNGMRMFIRIGGEVSSNDLFVTNETNVLCLNPPDSINGDYDTIIADKSKRSRLRNILEYLRGQSVFYQGLTIVREDDAAEGLVYQLMIEDRTVSLFSLNEFITNIYQHTSAY